MCQARLRSPCGHFKLRLIARVLQPVPKDTSAMPTLAARELPTTCVRRIAILGNPNSGKTTVFNALTGLHHKVGNYPGVTVERREAKLALADHHDVTLVDLPGTYSLVPRSKDERIARDVLLGLLKGVAPIDGVLIVIDSGNLRRNLYLATQIIDLGFPAVLCCNMIDAAEANGEAIDIDQISERLGIADVPTVANRGQGIGELKQAINALNRQSGHDSKLSLPDNIQHQLEGFVAALEECHDRLGSSITAPIEDRRKYLAPTPFIGKHQPDQRCRPLLSPNRQAQLAEPPVDRLPIERNQQGAAVDISELLNIVACPGKDRLNFLCLVILARAGYSSQHDCHCVLECLLQGWRVTRTDLRPYLVEIAKN